MRFQDGAEMSDSTKTDPKFPLPGRTFTVSDLSKNSKTPFSVIPDEHHCEAIARTLGVDTLRKLRFEGSLSPVGKADWSLRAHLGATVVQPCVATLEPVTTRIDTQVLRRFLAKAPDEPAPGSETEMPEDETEEPLGREIDLTAIMIEELGLAIPAYPRLEGTATQSLTITEPGITPMTDDEARPFAGLASLKDQLKRDG